MATKIGINGFGRIGRQVLRIASRRDDVEIVAINSRSSVESHAHLLKYDSTYGIFEKSVSVENGNLNVDGQIIHVYQENDPSQIPWEETKVDIVIESTGVFRKREDAAKHLRGTVKKVIISAPGKEIDASFVLGVNHNNYNPEIHHVIDNASCTTNCLAPISKVLDENFGIKHGLLTTVHAFTNDQNILDNSHKDPRRSRTASQSIIPTSTGAAKAVGKVLPSLNGKLDGLALRVPTVTSSIVDLTCELETNTTAEEINQAFENAKNNELKGILDVSYEPLVSIDYTGNEFSSIVDALSTQLIGNNFVKVLAWYDNEWGYSCRITDLAAFVGSKF